MKSITDYHLIQPYLEHLPLTDPDGITHTYQGRDITSDLIGVCHKVIDDLASGVYKDDVYYPVISVRENKLEFVVLSMEDMESIVNEGLSPGMKVVPLYDFIRRHSH